MEYRLGTKKQDERHCRKKFSASGFFTCALIIMFLAWATFYLTGSTDAAVFREGSGSVSSSERPGDSGVTSPDEPAAQVRGFFRFSSSERLDDSAVTSGDERPPDAMSSTGLSSPAEAGIPSRN
ncbi:MAG: hypothetical protein LBR87_07655 [Synergistaceae bacterium]|jgi:hypothetical protein|nr:hypothetical protein [Synergistaceae bacterium]